MLPISATLSYQTTKPLTNTVTGSPNTPVDIAAGALQTFVLAITPAAPISPTDVHLAFDCANSPPAPTITGVNTLPRFTCGAGATFHQRAARVLSCSSSR